MTNPIIKQMNGRTAHSLPKARCHHLKSRLLSQTSEWHWNWPIHLVVRKQPTPFVGIIFFVVLFSIIVFLPFVKFPHFRLLFLWTENLKINYFEKLQFRSAILLSFSTLTPIIKSAPQPNDMQSDQQQRRIANSICQRQ